MCQKVSLNIFLEEGRSVGIYIVDMDFMHHIQGIVILNVAGERAFAKYYINPEMQTHGVLTTVEKQRTLEIAIHEAARDPKRSCNSFGDEDIMLYGGHTILFQVSDEVTFAVIGVAEENELVLQSVLRGLIDSLRQELKSDDLSLRILLEKFDAIILTVDEMIDEGIILETDSSRVAEDVMPFVAESGSDMALKALSKVNKYLKENL
uniref:Coatomer subunit zeta n=1 Tax=Trypanosoma congolense (strain IL3000) TaxID=1068625 RepID=G0UW30_TRYCI|nr:putative coatomer zeta subunit [Trypanosoma congolense IL3000]